MWDGGFTEYIHDWWNLMDFAMNSLYLATISLKIVAYVKVKMKCVAFFSFSIILMCCVNKLLNLEQEVLIRKMNECSINVRKSYRDSIVCK